MRDDLTSEHPEVIWAAGFLEGEGSFVIDKENRWRMGAGQVHHEPLDRLAQTFECGRIYFRNQDPAVRRSWWGWEVTKREEILWITGLIAPWLTTQRSERIPWINEARSSRNGGVANVTC